MNKKIKILTTIFLVTLFIIGCKNTVKAASANISASNTSITQGDTITITTTINGASWDINLSGAISQGYADTTNDAENGNKSYTYSFTPTEAGTYTIKLSGNVSDSNEIRNTVSDEITINVAQKESNTTTNENPNQNTSNTENTENSSPTTTETETSAPTNTTQTTTTQAKSNNANLSNLGINPNDFTGFKPGTTSYNVTVPNNVEQITVYARLQDSKATLTGTGAKTLEIGKNTINVKVTAEDGTEKTYTINVTREEKTADTEEENTTTNEVATEDPTNANTAADLIKLEITGYNLTPKFLPDIYEYSVNINEDISKLDIVTEGANHNVKIEVVGNTDLKEGANTITILVYNEETGTNSTYQIEVNKTNVDLEGLNTELNTVTESANKTRYIILGIILFIIIGIIIFIIVKKRNMAYNAKNDIYEYDEEDMERINLDDEETFFNRVNKKEFEIPEEKAELESIDEPEKEEVQKEIEVNEEEEEKEEYFKASNKRKGKHF